MLIVLTVRMNSDRYPGKVMADIGGQPLLSWVTQRYQEAGEVHISCPDELDSPIPVWAKQNNIPYTIWTEDENDVLGRIIDASQGQTYVMRGLGDCMFPEPTLIRRSVDIMQEANAQMFSWALPGWVWPAYGAREFPLHNSIWQEMDAKATKEEHEHPDLFLHRHHDRFQIAYHEPPSPHYFRPHRLEVDYPEDIEMLRVVWQHFQSWPTLIEVLQFLDANPKVAQINYERVEKTGPYVSYSQTDRDAWAQAMRGEPIWLWNDRIFWPTASGKPIFCTTGTCFLGMVDKGWLYLKEGISLHGPAQIPCACGAGRFWHTS